VRELVTGAVALGRRVLDIGAFAGDVLAAVEPNEGIGVKLADKLTEMARERHPELRFEIFDVDDIVLSDGFRPNARRSELPCLPQAGEISASTDR